MGGKAAADLPSPCVKAWLPAENPVPSAIRLGIDDSYYANISSDK